MDSAVAQLSKAGIRSRNRPFSWLFLFIPCFAGNPDFQLEEDKPYAEVIQRLKSPFFGLFADSLPFAALDGHSCEGTIYG